MRRRTHTLYKLGVLVGVACSNRYPPSRSLALFYVTCVCVCFFSLYVWDLCAKPVCRKSTVHFSGGAAGGLALVERSVRRPRAQKTRSSQCPNTRMYGIRSCTYPWWYATVRRRGGGEGGVGWSYRVHGDTGVRRTIVGR